MNRTYWAAFLLLAIGLTSMGVEASTEPGQWHGWQVAWGWISFVIFLTGAIIAGIFVGWRYQRRGFKKGAR